MKCLCCPAEKAQLELTETLCATSFSVGTSVVTEAPLGFGELADDDCHVATEAVGSDTVDFPLVKEDADFAVIRVLLPDVVPQLLEAALHALVTDRAANVEQSSYCFLQSTILEANAILSVPFLTWSRSC